MSTLAEIEAAARKLPLEDKMQLLSSIGKALTEEQKTAARPHSILEIPAVNVGQILHLGERGDLLDEMLEDRI